VKMNKIFQSHGRGSASNNSRSGVNYPRMLTGAQLIPGINLAAASSHLCREEERVGTR
jgi:hypothetical protein